MMISAVGGNDALQEALGRELARRGCTVVCSGCAECNPHAEFPIITGLGYARNVIIALSGEAVVAVDGSLGTLSEIAYALAYSKPVIGLHTWRFSPGRVASGDSDQLSAYAAITCATNAADAAEKAVEAAKTRRVPSGGDHDR